MDGRGQNARRLTLLVRAYCHLCDDMRDAVAPLADRFGWDVDEIDIDADAVLERALERQSPVLLAGDEELCHYWLDEPAVTAFLSAASGRKVALIGRNRLKFKLFRRNQPAAISQRNHPAIGDIHKPDPDDGKGHFAVPLCFDWAGTRGPP